MMWVIATWLTLSGLASVWCLAACIVAGRADRAVYRAEEKTAVRIPRSGRNPAQRAISLAPQLALPYTQLEPATQRVARRRLPRE